MVHCEAALNVCFVFANTDLIVQQRRDYQETARVLFVREQECRSGTKHQTTESMLHRSYKSIQSWAQQDLKKWCFSRLPDHTCWAKQFIATTSLLLIWGQTLTGLALLPKQDHNVVAMLNQATVEKNKAYAVRVKSKHWYTVYCRQYSFSLCCVGLGQARFVADQIDGPAALPC